MRACRPGMTETQLEAELVYEFMRGNARSPAYSCIVAGGAFIKENDIIPDNSIVMGMPGKVTKTRNNWVANRMSKGAGRGRLSCSMRLR